MVLRWAPINMNVFIEDSWKPRWTVHNLAQIEHLRAQDMLDIKELSGHGIYLFTRRFVPEGTNIRTEYSFTDWIDHQLSLSSGDLESGVRTHFARGEVKIRLGVPDLPPVAEEVLSELAKDLQGRTFVRTILREIPTFVLYCGETHLFSERVAQHLDGSAAMNRLTGAGYRTGDLDFRTLPFPAVQNPKDPEVTQIRQTIERLVAQLTLAPFTKRPG